jgi:hypothetical protein
VDASAHTAQRTAQQATLDVDAPAIGEGILFREPNEVTMRFNERLFRRQKSRDLCCWSGCQNPKTLNGNCDRCMTDSHIALSVSFCEMHGNHSRHLAHFEQCGMWVDILSRSAFLRHSLDICNSVAEVYEMSRRFHRCNLCPSTFFRNRVNFSELCDEVRLLA